MSSYRPLRPDGRCLHAAIPAIALITAAAALAPARETLADSCASWDPSVGQPGMGGGAGSTAVRGLAVFDDGSGPALHATGDFTTASGVTVGGVARWDGALWWPLGGGPAAGLAGEGHALAVFDDGSGPALFVGGQFTAAGGVPAFNIARWDGAAWSTVPAGGGPGCGDCAVPNSLATGCSDPACESIVCDDEPFCCAEAWDEYCAEAAINMCACDLIGANGGVFAFAVFDDGAGPALYAGGAFTEIGGVAAGRVARWDGAAWSPVGSFNGAVRALAVFDDGSGPALYAGGAFTGRIARWNAGTWAAVGGGADGPVYALAVHANAFGTSLYAGGTFTAVGAVAGTAGIARWNGSVWASVSGGFVPGASVDALAAFDDGAGVVLFAAGDWSGASGNPGENIARWNSAEWSPLGAGTSGVVAALASHDDGSGPALYAGGVFGGAGGQSAGSIARWVACTLIEDACCMPDDGSCQGVPDEAACVALGGVYQGPGTICESAGCILDCNGNDIDDYDELFAGTATDCNVNGFLDECDIDGGASLDANGNGIPDECQPVSPPADTDGDGDVDVDDLNNVIIDWGTDGSAHGGDVTGALPGSGPDGIVDVNDLNAVIVGWGQTSPICVNGVCEPLENCATCPADCGVCVCGDQMGSTGPILGYYYHPDCVPFSYARPFPVSDDYVLCSVDVSYRSLQVYGTPPPVCVAVDLHHDADGGNPDDPGDPWQLLAHREFEIPPHFEGIMRIIFDPPIVVPGDTLVVEVFGVTEVPSVEVFNVGVGHEDGGSTWVRPDCIEPFLEVQSLTPWIALNGSVFDQQAGNCQCPFGELPDCSGACFPASWLGDQFCDDGTRTWNDQPISLECAAYLDDSHDCCSLFPGEDEPVCADEYVDSWNGGCDTALPIACGETVCGTFGTFMLNGQSARDEDWYQITLTEPAQLVWAVYSSFPLEVSLAAPGAGCPDLLVLDISSLGSFVVSKCVMPGTYYLSVAAGDGVPCGSAYTGVVTCQPVCDNDSCSSPVWVGPGTYAFDTTGATTDGPTTNCDDFGDNQVNQDIWFGYVAAVDALVTVNLCDSLYDTKLAVYEDPFICPVQTEEIACNDDGLCDGTPTFQSSVTFLADAGASYRIRVGGFLGQTGPGTMTITEIPNDDCTTPLLVTPGLWPFDTTDATTDGPLTTCTENETDPHVFYDQIDHDLWYAYVPACDALVTIDTCDIDLDTKLAVYAVAAIGDCPLISDEIACNDDFDCNDDGVVSLLDGSGSRVTFPAAEGQVLLIRLGSGGLTGTPGSGSMTISAGCNVVFEGEPDCADDTLDTTNGGCSSTPAMYTDIECGNVIAGTAGTFDYFDETHRDTDWFRLVLTEQTTITWMMQAAFATRVGIIDQNGDFPCVEIPLFLASDGAAPNSIAIVTECLAPGTWYLWAGPDVFTGVPCGSPYTATLLCSSYCDNDQCATPAWVVPGTHAFDSTGATTDGPVTTCDPYFDDQVHRDVWFRYMPVANGVTTVDLCGTSFSDSKLVVYLDAGCPSVSEEVACNDDSASCGLHSATTFNAVAGQPYLIRVGSYFDTEVGPGTLSITESPAVPEAEGSCGDYVEVNGGCESAAPLTVTCGTMVTGTTGTEITYPADIDYWHVETTTMAAVSWTVTAEFGFELTIHELVGPGMCIERASAFGLADQTVTVTYVGPPGDYYVAIEPLSVDACGQSYTGVVDCRPPNDECAAAIDVTEGVTAFDTTRATISVPESPNNNCGPTFVNDIYYRYTAPCPGWVTVSLCGSSFDTMVEVYDADCPQSSWPQSAWVACDENACGLASEVGFPTPAGVSYLIRVGGSTESPGNASGAGTMDVSIACTATAPGIPGLPSPRDAPGSTLTRILDAWGDCPGCAEDLTGDGLVNEADVAAVLDGQGDRRQARRPVMDARLR